MRLLYAFLIILTLLCGPTYAQQMLMASTPPVGQFVFAGPGPLDPRITFTRSSARTCWAATTFLVTLGNNQPCFDYYPGTSVPRGLLIEGSRTNLLLWNRDLTNAAWTKSNMTVAKTATGLDGVANSASRLTATSNNGTVLQAVTSGSAARATTAYVRRVSGTGTVEMTQNGGTNWTAVTVTSQWTRVGPASATITNPSVGFRLATSGDAIEVDFVQLENGTFASSAIATGASAVTRASDNAQIAHLASIGFNPVEWSIYAEYESAAVSNTSFGVITQFDNNASNANRASMRFNGSGGDLIGDIQGGANFMAQGPLLTYPAIVKAAMGYAANNASIVANAGTPSIDTLVSTPTDLSVLRFGQAYNNSSVSFIWLRATRVYTYRLLDSELQFITQ